jgi:oxygen-dependent protoporphyrinogen oxidase
MLTPRHVVFLAVTNSNSTGPPRIAIIGGGITGLAAAFRLQELLPRVQLALFEAAPRLGGVIDTVRVGDFLVERAADNFLTEQPAAVELCRQLGLAEHLLQTDESRRRAFVVRDGRLLPIPSGFYLMSPRKLWPLLASPILSLSGKLRLLVEPFVTPRAPRNHSDIFDPASSGDESVASFARRRLGREAYQRLVQPLVAGIYTADPEKLSMAATMREFLDQERTQGSLLRAAFRRRRRCRAESAETASGARYSLFVAPKEGMASLVAALAERLPRDSIHLKTPVSSITKKADGRWQIDCESARAGSLSTPTATKDRMGCLEPRSAYRDSQLVYDALVIATPAYATADLLKTIDAELSAELAAIEYAGCAVVSLGFGQGQVDQPLEGFGFVVPYVERRRIIAASFASQKFTGRAPAGTFLVRAFLGGALQPELLHLPDAELRQIALEELRELLGIRGEPLIADIARWPRSMPQYHVGHLARVARIEQLAARYPTLALAGNAYHGVGIPQCIASAHSAAERIATFLLSSHL